ncbi:unnamed protein product, partial [Notodromas monacha]
MLSSNGAGGLSTEDLTTVAALEGNENKDGRAAGQASSATLGGESDLLEGISAGNPGNGSSPAASDDEDEFRYDVLDAKQLRAEMQAAIAEVQQIIKASPRQCSENEDVVPTLFLSNNLFMMLPGLLRHRYLLFISSAVAEKEGENSSAPGSPTKRRSSAKSKSSLLTTFECGICMEPAKPTWRGEDAGCGHRFCRDCYRDYISSRILSGTMNEWATCPQSDCEQLVSHEQIESLLSADSHALQLYARFLVNSYVDSHKSVKWCPAPDCEFAVRVREGI